MNLLVGLAILLTLACAEFQSGSPVSELPLRLFLIGLTAVLVPGLAWMQTSLLQRRYADRPDSSIDQHSILNRLSACHTAVWLAASLATIVSFRWHEVVRVNWSLGDWILLDELLILSPMLISLLASWAIFFDLQRHLAGQTLAPTASQPKWFSRDRLEFIALRFQVNVLVLAVPLVALIAVHDAIEHSGGQHSMVTGVFAVVVLLGCLLFYPEILIRLWNTVPLPPNHSLTSAPEISGNAGQAAMPVRVWRTGGQLINACAVGMLPRRKTILLTDRLLELFPDHEIRAVLRHEQGHLQRRHAGWRIAFALLPLACLMLITGIAWGTLLPIEVACSKAGWEPWIGWIGFSALFSVYLLVFNGWLSHQMEFEADLWAARPAESTGEHARGQFQNRDDMVAALLRLAACQPRMFDRSTWMHPSILRRTTRLQSIESSGEQRSRLHRYVTNRWRSLALAFAGWSALALSMVAGLS